MNIEALSALFVAIAVLAIGASVLLRDRTRKTYTSFSVLCLTITMFYLCTFIAGAIESPWFHWAALFPAAFLPTTAIRFFRAFLSEPNIGGKLRRAAVTYVWTGLWILALLYGAFGRPIHQELYFQIPFATYVFGGLFRCVVALYVQYRETIARSEKARIRYLMIGGFVATTWAVLGFVPGISGAFAIAGNFFTILYLYFLSQTIFRYRMLDLNELLGRMLLLLSLVGILTVVYGILLSWVSDGKHQRLFILSTVVASFVILILVEPVRTFLENTINRYLLRERYMLTSRMEDLRRELMNVIDVREMVSRVVGTLERSRRVTHASVYLIDGDGAGCDLAGHVGPKPVDRMDVAARSPFFERLKSGVILLEGLEGERQALEGARGSASEKETEKLDSVAHALNEMNASLAIPIIGGGSNGKAQVVIGVLSLRDERLADAFGADDIDQFSMVAAQAAITIENSQVYERMQERDRLAALGEMAAGLAHEIRNPLSAIKGAAQLLVDPKEIAANANVADVGEYLEIIVEEVNRLNNVVTQFLSYARPYKGATEEVDVNKVVRRTGQLLSAPENATPVTIDFKLAKGLPHVRGDAEQIRQICLNLGLNAIQAMPDGGKLTIGTSLRAGQRPGDPGSFVEIRFRDSGQGIAKDQIKNLFIPFFTTKSKGTGLGLPISQRIVAHHGGRIEVRSRIGLGSTFYVLLPLAEDTSVTTTGTISRSALG